MKNRTVQLIFQTVFCTLGVVAVLTSFGLFDFCFRKTWYVYFTNLSNYFCIGIMFVELFQTVKKKQDDYVTIIPNLKFMGLLMILLTFLVFNLFIMFDDTRDICLNFTFNSIAMHQLLPIMYILDWLLFYKHGLIKMYTPIISALIPLSYVCFIYIRAGIHRFKPSTPLLYPYFFLDIKAYGVLYSVKWIGLLSIFFVATGYIFYFIDFLLATKRAK